MPDRQADFHRGYEAGYAKGVAAGRQGFGERFDGVSIIIPTFNKKEMLLECLDSIEAFTDYPYELIVVDNGSRDGTAEELRRRRGPLRLAVNQANLGFARAVNIGLMMAKGRYLVLLNNDVLVTERWIVQLLRCLRESPDAAAVGPVTNYISGEQQIETAYGDITGMRAFAAAHNRSDPGKWRDADRLVGFCLLFPRSTFEQIGYFDEGYELGNFEDDDWILRLRLQGKKLKIAGDTFVHHYGSMTMKELGERKFAEVNVKNGGFFEEKWGRIHAYLSSREEGLRSGGSFLRMPDFYPPFCWVRSATGRIYWLEAGTRRLLAPQLMTGSIREQAVRLSVVDLLQIPVGPEISTPEELFGLQRKQREQLAVFQDAEERLYINDRGTRREIVSAYTSRVWGLPLPSSPSPVTGPGLSELPEGHPVLPPVVLASDVL
ncbi:MULTISPECIES: glycosyltransferase family 2 protein [Paenibacillus]|uniref:glycosyltransferase family 2 protein n=1 Tax=Paenibacillus TaxID=44249 RepID=UPI002FE3CEB0